MLFMCHVVFHAMAVHVVHVPSVFSCFGGSCCSCVMVFFKKSWWFMFCLYVMVVHAVHVPFVFFMSWKFMLFMCHGVFSCHGGSCSCAKLFCSCSGGSCCSLVMVFF